MRVTIAKEPTARWQTQLLGILESFGMQIAYEPETNDSYKRGRQQGRLEGLGLAMKAIHQ